MQNIKRIKSLPEEHRYCKTTVSSTKNERPLISHNKCHVCFSLIGEPLSSYSKLILHRILTNMNIYFWSPQLDNSLKLEYNFIGEKNSEVQKDGWIRKALKISNLVSLLTCTLLTTGEGNPDKSSQKQIP